MADATAQQLDEVLAPCHGGLVLGVHAGGRRRIEDCHGNHGVEVVKRVVRIVRRTGSDRQGCRKQDQSIVHSGGPPDRLIVILCRQPA